MSSGDEQNDTERLHELRDAAPNDDVEALVEIIQMQQVRIRDLERTVRSLTETVNSNQARLNVQSDGMSSPDSPHFDSRDQAVMEAIAENQPDTVSVQQFHELYKTHTDARNGSTISERVKTLTEKGPFEEAGSQEWRYEPTATQGVF